MDRAKVYRHLADRAELAAGARRDNDPVATAARAFHYQYVRRAGSPEAGLRGYEDELLRRERSLERDEHRVCMARSNLAVVLRDWGVAEDLERALALLRIEVTTRRRRWPGTGFTLLAEAVLLHTEVTAWEAAEAGHGRVPVPSRSVPTLVQEAAAVAAARGRLLGRASQQAVLTRRTWARGLLLVGELQLAEAVLHDVLVHQGDGTGPDASRTRLHLARVQLAAGELAEACRQLDRASTWIEAGEDVPPRDRALHDRLRESLHS